MMKFKVLILVSTFIAFSSSAFAQDSSKTEGSTQCLTTTAGSPDGTCADSITPPTHSTGPTLLGDNTNPKSVVTPSSGGSKSNKGSGNSETPKGDGKQ